MIIRSKPSTAFILEIDKSELIHLAEFIRSAEKLPKKSRASEDAQYVADELLDEIDMMEED